MPKKAPMGACDVVTHDQTLERKKRLAALTNHEDNAQLTHSNGTTMHVPVVATKQSAPTTH
eukprot:1134678-Amphidinium_carterae.1